MTNVGWSPVFHCNILLVLMTHFIIIAFYHQNGVGYGVWFKVEKAPHQAWPIYSWLSTLVRKSSKSKQPADLPQNLIGHLRDKSPTFLAIQFKLFHPRGIPPNSLRWRKSVGQVTRFFYKEITFSAAAEKLAIEPHGMKFPIIMNKQTNKQTNKQINMVN